MTINDNTPAHHPRSCTHCHGTGWDNPHRCLHHWTDDAPPDDNICAIAHGMQIAWAAYQDECQRLGREPNHGRFEHWP